MWAIHRLGAAVTPANPSYTADELVHQIQTSRASLLITCAGSLAIAEEAAKKAGLSKDRIIVFDARGPGASKWRSPYPLISQLMQEGLKAPPAFVEKTLAEGEGTKKIAYLCFSSGTTGKPKAVAIPHYSVISNVVQFATFNKIADKSIPYEKQRFRPGDVTLGMLPMYHIYSIVVVLHCTIFSGHTIVVFPKFVLQDTIDSIKKYSISHLWIVPPVVVLFSKCQNLKKSDLATVRYVMVGAAPLSPEVARQFVKILPREAAVGQVAPAELEGHLLDHSAVADAGVVGVPDEYSGEVPAAFIQLQPDIANKVKNDSKYGVKLKRDIGKWVADSKTRYKHLDGGVYFVDAVPKNPSGKILRRMLREKAKAMNITGPGRKAKL
ncbi:hypothetical protein FRC18_008125 [Serendipita sp. 400]|nr:hypothetical protein FRC18_008125 [Serendipita sp. 400]